MLLKLAKEFAEFLQTEIIGHRIEGNEIIFVLGKGGKFRMTEKQLKDALQYASEPEETPKPKSKKKGA
jgi:hypothetical protein